MEFSIEEDSADSLAIAVVAESVAEKNSLNQESIENRSAENSTLTLHDKKFRKGRIIFSGLLFIGIYLSLCFSNGQIKESILGVIHFARSSKNAPILQEKHESRSVSGDMRTQQKTENSISLSMPKIFMNESQLPESKDSQQRYMKYFTNNSPLKYSSGAAGKGMLPAVPGAESMGLVALNWLRGAWQLDLGDTILQIEISPSDAGGNYLIGRKELRLADGSLLWIAILVIVRNPISELYETWEFRSDGSFGGGIMEQFGPQWSAPMKYILADGRTMTAVVTFTPQTGGGFIWQENSRTLSDLPLPALGPINARPLAPTGRESFFK